MRYNKIFLKHAIDDDLTYRTLIVGDIVTFHQTTITGRDGKSQHNWVHCMLNSGGRINIPIKYDEFVTLFKSLRDPEIVVDAIIGGGKCKLIDSHMSHARRALFKATADIDTKVDAMKLTGDIASFEANQTADAFPELNKAISDLQSLARGYYRHEYLRAYPEDGGSK